MIQKKFSRWLPGAGRIAVAMLFFSGLFSRCANVSGTMEGGPRDTLPPRVVRMTPAYNATGVFPTRVTIEFDEMIQLKDMQNQFFTSPFMEQKPVVSYRNRSAIVTIDSPLEPETTYQLNLGSGVVDNNEGNPVHGLKYTFSTGDHIDSMYMSGYVSDARTADTVQGAYLFFFDAKLDTVPGQDSLLFNLRRASAVTRTLTDGGFVYPNLKPIDYRVYALEDKNNNGMYDPGTDAVAFLDSVQNPTRLPSFLMWYDSVRMHMVAQPQLFFRTFVEEVRRPQNLTASSRPAAQQLLFRFAAPDPVIERLTLDGISPDKIMTEYLKPTRDSISWWLDIPVEELPDTLRGTIAYERPDSTGQLSLHEQELRLVWNRPASAAEKETAPAVERPLSRRRQRRAAARALADSLAAARLEADLPDSLRAPADSLPIPADSLAVPVDSVPKSAMKFTFSDADPVIPGIPPVLSFELPLRRMDRDTIRLFRVAEAIGETGEAGETPVEFTLEQDSLLIRRYTILGEWADSATYRLFIPPGALETIDGERNDSVSHLLRVAKKEDMGSVAFVLTDPPADYQYIVQVTDEKGDRVLREAAHLEMGTHEIGYLEKGKIRLRLIEDRDRNGRWDPGDLIHRRQPEQIAWYQALDSLSFDLQGDVELEPIDVTAIFRPRALPDTLPILPADAPDGEEGVDGEAIPVPGTARADDLPYPGPGQAYQTSEARVESFELADPRAARRAARAARKAAKAAAKEARRIERREFIDNLEVYDPDEEHDHDH